MKYYKYLPDLPWQPVAEKLKWYLLEGNKSYLSDNNWEKNLWRYADLPDLFKNVPEIKELFKPMELNICMVAFFVSGRTGSNIHRDADRGCVSRINLPVMNCENTETRYYTTDYPEQKKLQDNGVYYHYIDPKTCTHVDSFFLNCPAIIKVNEPHRVVGTPDGMVPRISCTIGFREEIIHLIDEQL
jgi:hypothetical protein